MCFWSLERKRNNEALCSETWFCLLSVILLFSSFHMSTLHLSSFTLNNTASKWIGFIITAWAVVYVQIFIVLKYCGTNVTYAREHKAASSFQHSLSFNLPISICSPWIGTTWTLCVVTATLDFSLNISCRVINMLLCGLCANWLLIRQDVQSHHMSPSHSHFAIRSLPLSPTHVGYCKMWMTWTHMVWLIFLQNCPINNQLAYKLYSTYIIFYSLYWRKNQKRRRRRTERQAKAV